MLKQYNCEFEKINHFGNNVFYLDSVINFGVDYIDADYELLYGYHVQTPNSVKKLKLFLNREKDYKDIQLIEKWEKRRG